MWLGGVRRWDEAGGSGAGRSQGQEASVLGRPPQDEAQSRHKAEQGARDGLTEVSAGPALGRWEEQPLHSLLCPLWTHGPLDLWKPCEIFLFPVLHVRWGWWFRATPGTRPLAPGLSPLFCVEPEGQPHLCSEFTCGFQVGSSGHMWAPRGTSENQFDSYLL